MHNTHYTIVDKHPDEVYPVADRLHLYHRRRLNHVPRGGRIAMVVSGCAAASIVKGSEKQVLLT